MFFSLFLLVLPLNINMKMLIFASVFMLLSFVEIICNNDGDGILIFPKCVVFRHTSKCHFEGSNSPKNTSFRNQCITFVKVPFYEYVIHRQSDVPIWYQLQQTSTEGNLCNSWECDISLHKQLIVNRHRTVDAFEGFKLRVTFMAIEHMFSKSTLLITQAFGVPQSPHLHRWKSYLLLWVGEMLLRECQHCLCFSAFTFITTQPQNRSELKLWLRWGKSVGWLTQKFELHHWTNSIYNQICWAMNNSLSEYYNVDCSVWSENLQEHCHDG